MYEDMYIKRLSLSNLSMGTFFFFLFLFLTSLFFFQIFKSLHINQIKSEKRVFLDYCATYFEIQKKKKKTNGYMQITYRDKAF